MAILLNLDNLVKPTRLPHDGPCFITTSPCTVLPVCTNVLNLYMHFISSIPLLRILYSCSVHKRIRTVGEGGHVRIAKVQHTLDKAVHALGCLYLVIIMSNYSRFIMPVKKLQFPP